MLAAILVLFTIVILLTLMVGLLIGWTIKTYFEENPPSTWTPHPELFNADGTLIPQTEMLAIRVEGDSFYDEMCVDDDDD
jgi:hypothetical protein